MQAAWGGTVLERMAGDLRALVVAFTVGVLAVFALRTLPSLELYAALAVTAALPWRGRALWAAAVLGVLLAGWHGQQALDRRWPASRHGEEIELRGTVVSLPERRAGADGGADLRFEFEPESDIAPRRMRVSWYGSESVVRGGDCWRLRLRMRTPHGSLNPGGFDYEGWLLRERIDATATVRSGEFCGMAGGQRVLQLRQRIAEHLLERLGARPAAALAVALVVGDGSVLRDADWDRFRRTGTTHLMVISGFHLAIVAGFALLLLRWLWSLWPALCLWLPAQRVALFGSALVAAGYALVSGMGTPVTRALVMLLVLVLAAATHRLHQPSRALALAWGLIVLLDPFAVLSPGLWLSFAAVAAIFYVSSGRLRQPSAWRLLVRVQLLLSAVSLPLTLYFFQGLSWLSPLVNLAAVPLFGLLVPALFVAVLLSMFSGAIAEWALRWIAQGLDGIHAGLGLVATLPQTWLPASAAPAALLLAALGAVLIFAPWGLPSRALGVVCMVPLLWPRAPSAEGLTVTALDVGQGLAVVVRTAAHTLVYDAGPAFDEGFDAGRSVVAPYLLAQGLRRIDRLVLSHDHNDHAGGIGALRALLPVADEIGTAQGRPCVEDEGWEWDGVRFRLLHPQTARGDDNEQSCVLRIEGPYSVLLPGDIERRSERRLLRERRADLAADVLLSPHHGSRTSSSADFVAAARPAVVVHSAGWRSRFGHPRPEVRERYADIGARQYVTGVVGAVTIRQADDGGLRVEEYRREHARWWNAAAEP
ncbi:DNA internalization-related competence protein ComEC/Rec2 [Fontimonas sp. SYSU GA230001]|uniref:DNA internalization-related competence protein ComEC/Rec2 n=1 Tax=Fontimonas sp. SYSU GA230001 TaxID=3142450 RepID=UPI0032B4A791